MPNFWTGMGRMLSGKPIYDPNDPDIQNMQDGGPSSQTDDTSVQNQAQVAPPNPYSPIVKGDDRTFPVLQIRRVDNRYNGNNVQVFFRIYNASPMQVWLDRIKVFGAERRINDDLRPRQEQQYAVYSGPQFKNKDDDKAKLKFKTMDGDYFEIEYELRFNYHTDHAMYECNEVHQHGPVRDIYEY